MGSGFEMGSKSCLGVGFGGRGKVSRSGSGLLFGVELSFETVVGVEFWRTGGRGQVQVVGKLRARSGLGVGFGFWERGRGHVCRSGSGFGVWFWDKGQGSRSGFCHETRPNPISKPSPDPETQLGHRPLPLNLMSTSKPDPNPNPVLKPATTRTPKHDQLPETRPYTNPKT